MLARSCFAIFSQDVFSFGSDLQPFTRDILIIVAEPAQSAA